MARATSIPPPNRHPQHAAKRTAPPLPEASFPADAASKEGPAPPQGSSRKKRPKLHHKPNQFRQQTPQTQLQTQQQQIQQQPKLQVKQQQQQQQHMTLLQQQQVKQQPKLQVKQQQQQQQQQHMTLLQQQQVKQQPKQQVTQQVKQQSQLQVLQQVKREDLASESGQEPQEEEAASAAAASADASLETAEAAAAADHYLLEDAEYLRREKRWLNCQRVLLFASRGISARARHLLEDLKRLLPHHKAETKWEKKEKLQGIAELCQLRSCNNVLYLEQRRSHTMLYVAKVPLGPTFIARLMNVETLQEARLVGNCLLHSRPLLLFGRAFEQQSPLRLLKELFMQVFGTPRNHPKTKPFFDHVIAFFFTDGRIWFRHYQIAPLVLGEGGDANNPMRQTLIEIGPRFVLDPVKILDCSFSGKTLWRNSQFIHTRDLMKPRQLQSALQLARREAAKEKRKRLLETLAKNESPNPFAPEDVFGADEAEQPQEETKKRQRRAVGL